MATAADHPDIDLLLIGKTGNGKSATGNSVLGKQVFDSKTSATSVTTDVKTETSLINGQIISVTDIPGLADTNYDKKTNLVVAKRSVRRAVEMVRGFSAILIVLRFGSRFTEEDQETVTIIKSMLGYSVIMDHCICIITCGDNFEKALKDEEDFRNFDEWRAQQTGNLKTLLEECMDRCVLFDNKTKDAAKLCAQRDKLMSLVEELRSRQSTGFSLVDFNLASLEQELREIVDEIPLLEVSVETLLVEIRVEHSQITRRTAGEGEGKGEGDEDKQFELELLRCRLESQRSYLEKRNGATGLLNDLIDSITAEEVNLFTNEGDLKVIV